MSRLSRTNQIVTSGFTLAAQNVNRQWVRNDTAERFGQRGALIPRRFKDGIVFETERTTEADFRKLNLERSLRSGDRSLSILRPCSELCLGVLRNS